jgi:RimJ/RimL family protein N-acetyltransferase
MEITTDARRIRDFMIQDETWWYCSEDDADAYYYEPVIDDNHIWVAYEDKALIYLERLSQHTVKAHLTIKKRYRQSHANKIAAEFFEFIQDTSIKKINIAIIDTNKDLKYFVESIGFVEEGLSRKSYLKGGNLQDQRYYGITIEEITCQQQQ